MKFRCERDTLVEALTTAGRAVSSRGGQLPVLSGLHLTLEGDTLKVTGSDLDLTITRELVVGGDEDGTAVIPSKLITDVVRALEGGAVELECKDLDVSIRGGRSDFSIRTIAADEFPDLAEPGGQAVTLDAGSFVSALKQVVKAASSDDSRPILTGVLLASEDAGLRLVATDSYRLAVRDLPGASVLDAGQKVLVPSRALNEVARLVDSADALTLRLGDSDATFEIDGLRVTTRLIDGDFPNYQGLIPEKNPNSLVVNRDALFDAVKRVRLMAQESTPVRLHMTSDGLELLAVTQDVGEAHETLDATYDGAELTVAFNAQFLLDGVEVSTTEDVRLETVDAQKPAVLRSGEDQDFLYLLMPVRVP